MGKHGHVSAAEAGRYRDGHRKRLARSCPQVRVAWQGRIERPALDRLPRRARDHGELGSRRRGDAVIPGMLAALGDRAPDRAIDARRRQYRPGGSQRQRRRSGPRARRRIRRRAPPAASPAPPAAGERAASCAGRAGCPSRPAIPRAGNSARLGHPPRHRARYWRAGRRCRDRRPGRASHRRLAIRPSRPPSCSRPRRRHDSNIDKGRPRCAVASSPRRARSPRSGRARSAAACAVSAATIRSASNAGSPTQSPASAASVIAEIRASRAGASSTIVMPWP